MRILDALIEPELKGIDMDSPSRIVVHRRILARKPMIRSVFADFYHLCRSLDERFFGTASGLRVELGAGVSLFKHFYPDVLITDIVPADHLDAVVDAQKTSFENASVRALYGINCFHHFPDPTAFFREFMRIVQPGGGCILVEPYHGPLARVLYKRLFTSETFDKAAAEWTRSGSEQGAMVGANQALSYLVFERDRRLLSERFPEIEVVHQEPLTNQIRYLLSGGLNFRPLAPAFSDRPLARFEALLAKSARLTALHQAVVLRRRANAFRD